MPGARRSRKSRTLNEAPKFKAPLWTWVLGTWFGSGLSPLVSGTTGTMATLPLVAMLGLGGIPGPLFWNPWPLLGAVLLFYPGVLAATAMERESGRHDDGRIVVDEAVGTLLTFSFLAPAAFLSPWVYLAGFFLFRIFDVWKPWIIGYSQSLPRGWGVMVDDVLGGLAAGLVLAGLRAASLL
ncbi:MAG: phosphatidylglycerophosphatase A [candidate division FCPU426 bacterium]